MSHDLQLWLIALVAVIAASAAIQTSILIAVGVGLRGLQAKINELKEMVSSEGSGARETVLKVREAAVSMERAGRNVTEITEQVKGVVNVSSELWGKELKRVDQVVDDVVSRVERTSKYVEEGVVEPIREIHAISAGIRAAAAVLFHHRDNSGKSRPTCRNAGPILLLAVLIAGAFGKRLRAQQNQSSQPALAAKPSALYEGQQVAFVDLVARPTIDVEALRPMVAQKAGEPYSNAKVQQTVDALNRTRQFTKVEVQVTPEATGLRVTFVMEPAFYIGTIDFPGALKAFSYPRMLQVVNYPAEQPYEESLAKGGQSALERFLSHNGYFSAKVETETKLDEQTKVANIIYHVSLNRHAKFGQVQVTGPPPDQAAQLERALRSFRARIKGAAVRQGKPYDTEKIRAATAYLRDYLGRENQLAKQVHFETPRYDSKTNRADLAFHVMLGPKVTVQVMGAKLSKRKVRRLIPIYEENAFDQDLVEEGERNLVSFFQSKGYFDVKVNSQVEEEPSVSYQVNQGGRHRLVDVEFRGNRRFDHDTLLAQVQVERGRFFSRGKFSNDLLAHSVKQLTDYYRAAGFDHVKVQPKVVERDPQVSATFEITEGPQTIVESLHIEGNKTQSIGALAPHGLKLGARKPYSRELLDQDRDHIVARYLDLGYPNVAFRPSIRPVGGRPDHVDVTYTIQEGPHVQVKGVALMGAKHTQDGFIDRSVDVRAGAPLSAGKLLESESRLYDLGIFDWASIDPRRPVTDQTEEEVLVKVHEAKRNSLSWGLGFEFEPRVGNLPVGAVALPGLPIIALPSSFTTTQKNFASPKGDIEYSRLDLFGRGETATIGVLAARLDQRATLTYSEPHFAGWNWSSLVSVSAERTSENPLFTARTGLTSFQLEKALDPKKTKTLYVRYSFNRTDLTNLLIPELVLPQDRSVRLSTVSTTFIRDTRDKPLDAHRGLYQSFDFGINPKAIGSNVNFVRFLGQTAYYRQVKPSLVWANDVRIGLAKPFAGSDVPLSESFFSGGADSLRGFPIDAAGPQRTVPVCINPENPSTCVNINVPVGGNQLFIWNSEGRFPLRVKKGLGGVIFYDGGNVYSRIGFGQFFKDYSNTVGIGLRYDTPVGPIRFDVGRNLNPVLGYKATQYFITLGQAF
jgi:outer membrane protein insertion porin family